MHALDEVDLTVVVALVARTKTAAMNAHQQRCRPVALLQPQVQFMPRVCAVGNVLVRGLELRPVGLTLTPLLLKHLRLGQREDAVPVGISRREALENLLQIRVGLGGRFGRSAEHDREQENQTSVHAASMPDIFGSANRNQRRQSSVRPAGDAGGMLPKNGINCFS